MATIKNDLPVSVGACCWAMLGTALSLTVVLRLTDINLEVPFTYDGDALYFTAMVKGIAQGDWFWYNTHLGAPFASDMRDFPLYMTLENAAVKLMSLFSQNAGLLINLLWLFGTVAAAFTATYAFQRLRISKWIAVGLGILYAVQPYGYWRNINHINLMYYLIPLLAAGAVELAVAEPEQPAASTGWRGLARCVWHRIPRYLLVAVVLQGFSYIYYGFFACFVFAVAALIATMRKRRDAALACLALIALLVVCAAVNFSPSVLYWVEHGRNSAMNYKSVAETETYGLKIRHILSPIKEHPLASFRWLERKLNEENFRPENENQQGRLGTVGTIGFLYLLYSLFRACVNGPDASGDTHDTVLRGLAILLMACLLVATVGGFATLFSALVSPDIRCYNRILVFMSFFCLSAVGNWVTRAVGVFPRKPLQHIAAGCAMGAVLCFGVADEAAIGQLAKPEVRSSRFEADRRFVQRVEKQLPANSRVMQLPYTDFPLDGPRERMSPYDHARPYLHSRTLQWSWAAVTGRGGEWSRETESLPVSQMLDRLKAANFSGIWLDTYGYPPGKSLVADLAQSLPDPAQRSDDGRFVFYSLIKYKPEYEKVLTTEQRDRFARLTLHPIEVLFSSEFYTEERNGSQKLRWCGPEGSIQFRNPLAEPREVTFTVSIYGGTPVPSMVRITGDGSTDTIGVGNGLKAYGKKLVIPPFGRAKLQFSYNGPRGIAPGDPRSLYFALLNWKVSESAVAAR